uniref:Uncharacterized protein n=1 Tax=Candidatus Kentrum sp. SD TaxID=2126332 RepID=A0A451BSG4_9GAMM|nr:MAG: hypothetical protein BECKSD772F_GA0070984_12681 [Candidatus Kentron sp. SD]VFK81215.1 MAG: hypothetical protein BECKSD772D_GA0070982_12551 [Candidatus Kentron sp. SD]
MAALPVLPECIVKENMMPLRGSRGRGVARASRLHSKGVDAFSLIHILLVPKIFIFLIHLARSNKLQTGCSLREHRFFRNFYFSETCTS